MRKLLISGLGVLSAAILVGPAFAADIKAQPRRQQPQQQQSSNWSGGQAGGSNGASSVNNSFVEPGAFNLFDCFSSFSNCQETPFSFSGNKVSYIIGAFLGYRVQMGYMVVGVEGDIYWKNAETSQVQTTFPPYLCPCGETFTGSQKQGADGSLRVRGGVLVTPDTLLYLTGGLAIGQISGSFSYYAPGFTYLVSGAGSWNDTRVGGTVGGGVETAIFPGSGLKARIEYRYTDFGSFSKDVPLFSTPSGCSPSDCGTNAHIELRAFDHRVTVGLGFDF